MATRDEVTKAVDEAFYRGMSSLMERLRLELREELQTYLRPSGGVPPTTTIPTGTGLGNAWMSALAAGNAPKGRSSMSATNNTNEKGDEGVRRRGWNAGRKKGYNATNLGLEDFDDKKKNAPPAQGKMHSAVKLMNLQKKLTSRAGTTDLSQVAMTAHMLGSPSGLAAATAAAGAAKKSDGDLDDPADQAAQPLPPEPQKKGFNFTAAVDAEKKARHVEDVASHLHNHHLAEPGVDKDKFGLSSALYSSSSSKFCLNVEEEDVGTWRGVLQNIVNDSRFDMGSCTFVFGQALVIGAIVDEEARNCKESGFGALDAVNYMLSFMFFLELILRVVANGSDTFIPLHAEASRVKAVREGWKWNCFDLCVFTIDVLCEVVSRVSGGGSTDLSALRLLRIFRSLRLVRVVRFLRFFGQLRTLVSSIIGSLNSLSWTVVLLTVLLYTLGIVCTQWSTNFRIDLGKEDPRSIALENLYGNVFRTKLTLFQSITGGMDWSDASEPINDIGATNWLFVFLLYIAFSLLCMLNVVTGVFVESALLSAKKQEDQYMIGNVKEFFRSEDGSMLQSITNESFMEQLKTKPAIQDYFKSIDVSPQEADGLFELVDRDNDGELDTVEFMHGLLELRGPARALELAILEQEFRHDAKARAEFMKELCTLTDRMESAMMQIVANLQSALPVQQASPTTDSPATTDELLPGVKEEGSPSASTSGLKDKMRKTKNKSKSSPSSGAA